MEELISKLQYKNFEPGEFIDEQKRSYEEIVACIENFPWNTERNNIVIGLTNPSVTLQNEEKNFLKFSLFFNNKYVLHYYTSNDELFTKSFLTITDAYPYIRQYFETDLFDTKDFKKETTWLQHNRKHFQSQSFEYYVTNESTWKFLLRTSWISLLFPILLLLYLIFSVNGHFTIILFLFLIIPTFFIGGGLNLILVLNYYNYAKNKVLKLSKGNDIFFYGNCDLPNRYNKK